MTGRNLATRRIAAEPVPPPPVAAVVSPLPPFAALLVRLVAAGPDGRSAVSVPAIMTDPQRLPKGQHWWHTCPHCGLPTQGGRPGLNAHLAVVHPGRKDPP